VRQGERGAEDGERWQRDDGDHEQAAHRQSREPLASQHEEHGHARQQGQAQGDRQMDVRRLAVQGEGGEPTVAAAATRSVAVVAVLGARRMPAAAGSATVAREVGDGEEAFHEVPRRMTPILPATGGEAAGRRAAVNPARGCGVS